MTTKLNQFWQGLIHAIDQGFELHVSHRHDRKGNGYFEVYDPTTRRSHEFESEHAVRTWLDQRHY